MSDNSSTSEQSIATMEKHSIAWSKALSILIIVAGVLAIAVPPAAGIAATILIGWLLVFGGAAHLVFGWHTRKVGGLAWAILLGLIYVLAGFYTLLHPLAGLAALTLMLGAYLSVQAILEFVLAWHLRRLGAQPGWCSMELSCSFLQLRFGRPGRRAASGSSARCWESA